MEKKTNVKAIIAIICGILALVLSFVMPLWYGLIPFVIAIVGIVFAAMGLKEAKASGSGKGMAVAGLICAIIATIFALCSLICAVACSAAIGAANSALETADMGELENYLSTLG